MLLNLHLPNHEFSLSQPNRPFENVIPTNVISIIYFYLNRYLQAIRTEKDDVTLVGKSFSPDTEKWTEDIVHIPRRKESEGVLT